MKILRIIIYLILLSVLTFYVYYLTNDPNFKWSYLLNIQGLLVFLFLNFISCYFSGIQLNVLFKSQNVKLSIVDKMLLPISMALFGYIIPSNGGLLFSLYFFKKKYNVTLVDGLSIGVFIIYISLFLTGIFGLLYCFYFKKQLEYIIPFSLLLLFSPFVVKLVLFLVIKFNRDRFKFLSKTSIFLTKISINISVFFKNKTILLKVLIINLIMIGIQVITIQELLNMFNIFTPIISIILMVMFMRLSSLIRVVPGNFGVEELFTGGIFLFFGLTVQDGILISVYARVISIILFIIPLGLLHIFVNREFLKISEFKLLNKKII